MPDAPRPMGGIRLWLLLTAFGTAVMVGLQWAFHRQDQLWIAPLTQAFALSITWMLAWPLWFRYQPHRRGGFLAHSLVIVVIAGIIAATRIALRLG